MSLNFFNLVPQRLLLLWYRVCASKDATDSCNPHRDRIRHVEELQPITIGDTYVFTLECVSPLPCSGKANIDRPL